MSMTNNDELALKAEQCANILENIAGFEPDDIDGDDIDLRFVLDGMDTGCTVSIVEQCQDAADTLHALLAERDADKKRIAEQQKSLEKAQSQSSKWLEAYHKAVSVGARYEERIAELEARTVSVKLPEPPRPMSVGARTVYSGIVADVVGAFQTGLDAAGIKLEVGE